MPRCQRYAYSHSSQLLFSNGGREKGGEFRRKIRIRIVQSECKAIPSHPAVGGEIRAAYGSTVCSFAYSTMTSVLLVLHLWRTRRTLLYVTFTHFQKKITAFDGKHSQFPNVYIRSLKPGDLVRVSSFQTTHLCFLLIINSWGRSFFLLLFLWFLLCVGGRGIYLLLRLASLTLLSFSLAG